MKIGANRNPRRAKCDDQPMAILGFNLRFSGHRLVQREVFDVQGATAFMRQIIAPSNVIGGEGAAQALSGPAPALWIGRAMIGITNPRPVQRLVGGQVDEGRGATKNEGQHQADCKRTARPFQRHT